MQLGILILVIGVGLFLAKRFGVGPLKALPKESEYAKSKEGDWTVFSVTPAAAPQNISFFLYIGALAFALIFIGSIAANSNKGGYNDPMAPIGHFLEFCGYVPLVIAIWWGLLRDARPKGYKNEAKFKVSPSALEFDGKTLNRDDVLRLLTLNSSDNDRPLVVTGRNAATAEMALAHRNKVSDVAYALAAEAGGKRHILAGGLTEPTVFALLSEASDILGMGDVETT